MNNKTLIVVASNSNQSINKVVAEQLKAKLSCDLISAADYDAPIYKFDDEAKNYPQAIVNYLDKLRNYENLVFFIPEHNGGLPAFFKNIVDWASRSKYGMNYLDGKKAIIVTVTPGPSGGQFVRKNYGIGLGFTGAKVLGTVGIGSYTSGKNVSAELNEVINLLK